jgi:hypothetical protein
MPGKPLEFSANKKWAISPLISPPAGAVTAIQADKLVCIFSIGQNAGNFNEKVGRRVILSQFVRKED